MVRSVSAWKPNGGDRLFDFAVNFLGLLVLALVLYPLVFVVSASFSSPSRVMDGEVLLFPKGLTLDPYARVFENQDILSGYRNSLLYVVVGTTINMFMTVLLAYPLSRKDLPFRGGIMVVVVITMFFSGGLIPTYLVVRNLGMVDTIWALVIPNAIVTYNMIVMRTYFQSTIPTELQESAWMDGCTNFRLLWSIVLPLSKPILAVILLYYSVEHWNAFFNALIYLQSRRLYPLQLILREILIESQTDEMGTDTFGLRDRILMAESIKYSVIIVASLPMVVLYPFIQRHFVKGVMIGAIKG